MERALAAKNETMRKNYKVNQTFNAFDIKAKFIVQDNYKNINEVTSYCSYNLDNLITNDTVSIFKIKYK